MRNILTLACLTIGFLSTVLEAAETLKLAPLFDDNMVLQRSIKVPVWGNAASGAEISVKLNGQDKKTKADENGKWSVKLEPLQAGGPFVLSVTDGKTAIDRKNVLVGDVWVCSGQSNMEYTVSKFPDATDWLKDADYPQIRLLTVANQAGWNRDFKHSGWKECSEMTAQNFSATAFFFGKEIYKSQKVPVGLISSAVSGTVIDTWISREALEKIPDAKKVIKNYEDAVSAIPEKKKQYESELEKRKGMSAEELKKLPPVVPQNVPMLFSRFFNGMISPLIPYGIKGVIWYQGESNAMFAQGEPYRRYLAGLISDWRERWGQGDFPFLIVQLPNYGKSNGVWPELRDSQSFVASSLPNVGMSVNIDIGETENIHPNNKPDVGKRLALLARNIAYGEKLISAGPTFKSMKIEDDGKVIIEFENIGGGLITKGDGALTGFLIAGENKKFTAAKAEIKGDKVIVSVDSVKKPVAIRYAWADNPTCNLYNKAGLPAAPFRTDTWRLLTQVDPK